MKAARRRTWVASRVRRAKSAAGEAGFPDFLPDACLVNRYEVGAKLSLHQDKDEQDFSAPIVSVSLGIPAVFVFGGLNRSDKTKRVPVTHGDVIVWGGPSRLRYHGVLPLKEGNHHLLDQHRVNLTFEALERQGFAGLSDSKGLDESLPQTLRIAMRRSRSKAG